MVNTGQCAHTTWAAADMMPDQQGPDHSQTEVVLTSATKESSRALPPWGRQGRNRSGGFPSTNIPLLAVSCENQGCKWRNCCNFYFAVFFLKATAPHSVFREFKCLSGRYQMWALRGAWLGRERWLFIKAHQPKPRCNCWYQTAHWAWDAVILRKHISLLALNYLDSFICNMDCHVFWGIL